MSTSTAPRTSHDSPAADTMARGLRRAAVQARQAPSVHNTQPWTFVLSDRALQIRADWQRQLAVLDPAGRQLVLSCGCAVFNARVALAAAGLGGAVHRTCDVDRPGAISTLTVDRSVPVDTELAGLEDSIPARRTNRRRLAPEQVAPQVVERLVAAAAAEGAELHEVTRADDRLAVARLSQLADRWENGHPAYRAEIRRWTTDDASRLDGVPASAVPAAGHAHDDVPIRDFDARGTAELPEATTSSLQQTMFVLGTSADTPAAWERAGEALQRIWLELTRAGYVGGPLTQVVETPSTRAALRHELRLTAYPHVLLRAGRAAPTPATRRRRLSDLILPAR